MQHIKLIFTLYANVVQMLKSDHDTDITSM